MRNTWITYLWHRDNRGKLRIIPDETTASRDAAVNGRVLFGGLSAGERSMSYQLVGGVTAHQGYDGYRD